MVAGQVDRSARPAVEATVRLARACTTSLLAAVVVALGVVALAPIPATASGRAAASSPPAASGPAASTSQTASSDPVASPGPAPVTFAVGGAHRMPVMPVGVVRNSAPAGAHLNYYGGHVIPHVKTYAVLYGAGTYFPQITSTGTPSASSFLGGVTNSPYMDWLNEYDTNVSGGTNQHIGRGTFAGKFTITPSAANNGTTIDDATNIQPEINAQITAGNLPAPDENTLYVLFFRQGQSITQGGSTSMVPGGFCAYHGTFARNAKSVYYAVMPDFTPAAGGCGSNPTPFNNVTSVMAHEVIEAVTDGEVGLATTFAPPLAWYDPTYGEIGDICNAQQGTVVGGDATTYVVQTEFSNAANNCIVTKAMPNDFSVSAPATASVNPGTSSGVNVTTAVTVGVSQTVALSVSGLPGRGHRLVRPPERGQRCRLDSDSHRLDERRPWLLPPGHQRRRHGEPHRHDRADRDQHPHGDVGRAGDHQLRHRVERDAALGHRVGARFVRLQPPEWDGAARRRARACRSPSPRPRGPTRRCPPRCR